MYYKSKTMCFALFRILGSEKDDDELEKEKKQRRVLTSVTWLI